MSWHDTARLRRRGNYALVMNRIHRLYCKSAHWGKTLEHRLLPWVIGETDLGENVLEVGPGPGLVTKLLQARTRALTSIEIDPAMAASLQSRVAQSGVRVVEGDATDMPFPDASFSAALSLTMLHHVPSEDLQDRLLAEVHRVLQPGAFFLGSDSLSGPLFRLVHVYDTLVPVDPNTFTPRLRAAGFRDIGVETAKDAFRFRARKPLLANSARPE